MAHKKGQGSTRNGRDSNPKYLGLKVSAGQEIQAGTIIVRQRGTRIHAGDNVGVGKDHTLYALQAGTVKFETFRGDRKRAVVVPDGTIGSTPAASADAGPAREPAAPGAAETRE